MTNIQEIEKLLKSKNLSLEVLNNIKNKTTFTFEEVKRIIYYSYINGQDKTLENVLTWFKEAKTIDDFYKKIKYTLEKKDYLLDE